MFILLTFTLFLTSCSDKIQLTETIAETSINYENENIKINISDNIDERESVYKAILEDLQIINDFSPIENIEIKVSKKYLVPDTENIIKCDDKFIETEEFKKELIKKSYGTYDNWIVEGLYTNIFDIETEDIEFSKYYENHDFSLFGARFFEPFSTKEEIESVKAASIDLVNYLIKNDKKAQLLKSQIQTSDMEKWAEDKNIDLAYQREIESLMNRMEVINKTNQLIINTKEEINGFSINIAYTDKVNEQYDTAEKIEQIILGFDRDILAIKKGIEEDAPNFYAEYKDVLNSVPKIEYIFDTNAEGIANYLDVFYSEAYINKTKSNFYEMSNYTEDNIELLNLVDDLSNIFINNDNDINNIDEIEKDKNKGKIVNHVFRLHKVKFHKVLGVEMRKELHLQI